MPRFAYPPYRLESALFNSESQRQKKKQQRGNSLGQARGDTSHTTVTRGRHLAVPWRNDAFARQQQQQKKYRQNGARCPAMTMRVRGAASAPPPTSTETACEEFHSRDILIPFFFVH